MKEQLPTVTVIYISRLAFMNGEPAGKKTFNRLELLGLIHTASRAEMNLTGPS
jgi:hypothetical protein